MEKGKMEGGKMERGVIDCGLENGDSKFNIGVY